MPGRGKEVVVTIAGTGVNASGPNFEEALEEADKAASSKFSLAKGGQKAVDFAREAAKNPVVTTSKP